MAEASALEQQQRIVGPDGVTYYLGDGVLMNPFDATSVEASVTIDPGMVVQTDATTTILPRFESVAAGSSPSADIPNSKIVKVVRAITTTPAPVVGVARGPGAPGKVFSLAGIGSLVCIKTVDSPSSAVVGGPVIKSSTAGKVDLIAIATAVTNGQGVGIQIKLPGTSTGQTGSATFVGALVVQK